MKAYNVRGIDAVTVQELFPSHTFFVSFVLENFYTVFNSYNKKVEIHDSK
jgi:hypothetical protein